MESETSIELNNNLSVGHEKGCNAVSGGALSGKSQQAAKRKLAKCTELPQTGAGSAWRRQNCCATTTNEEQPFLLALLSSTSHCHPHSSNSGSRSRSHDAISSARPCRSRRLSSGGEPAKPLAAPRLPGSPAR